MPSENDHNLIHISRKDISFKDVMTPGFLPKLFGKECYKDSIEYKKDLERIKKIKNSDFYLNQIKL